MNKILVIATFGLCAISAAGEELPASVSVCAGVSDDRARLACFDGLAARAAKTQPAPALAQPPKSQPVQSQPAQAQPFVAIPNQAAPAPVAPAPVAPAPQNASKADGFGAETIRKVETREEAAQEVTEIRAKVTAVSFSSSGKFTVTLDNGQVWRQIEGDTGHGRFHKTADNVVISHGLLGSYNLVIEGSDLVLYKVRRVK